MRLMGSNNFDYGVFWGDGRGYGYGNGHGNGSGDGEELPGYGDGSSFGNGAGNGNGGGDVEPLPSFSIISNSEYVPPIFVFCLDSGSLEAQVFHASVVPKVKFTPTTRKDAAAILLRPGGGSGYGEEDGNGVGDGDGFGNGGGGGDSFYYSSGGDGLGDGYGDGNGDTHGNGNGDGDGFENALGNGQVDCDIQPPQYVCCVDGLSLEALVFHAAVIPRVTFVVQRGHTGED